MTTCEKNMDMEGDSVVIWVFVRITVHPIITLLPQKLLITHIWEKAPISCDCFLVKKFSTNILNRKLKALQVIH
jgi:hypothetical protein